MTARADYIAGLRQLADLLEQHDELPLPYTGARSSAGPLLWILDRRHEQQQVLADIVRALPGVKHKGVRGTAFDLYATLHGLQVQVIADRDKVCERVVVGTETITHPAKAAEPERTETVETVEWRCLPLLADAEVVTA